MTDDVKPRRPYRSARRDRQARETRRSILDAAHGLFVERGWHATTVAAIAGAASASPESVYAIFGSKRALLLELISEAVRGDAPETPLLLQPGPAAIRAESDPRRRIALFATGITDVLERVAPLIAVVRTASQGESGIAGLYAELHAGRRRNLRFVAESLAMRDGMTIEDATAILWRLASPELFMLVTRVEGGTKESYRTWLEQSLSALLLPPAPSP